MERTVQQTGSDIKQRFAFSEHTAIETLAAASANSASLGELEQASVAQIVFPKALKGGFLFGANYSEGFVVKDQKAIARVQDAVPRYCLGINVEPSEPHSIFRR